MEKKSSTVTRIIHAVDKKNKQNKSQIYFLYEQIGQVNTKLRPLAKVKLK